MSANELLTQLFMDDSAELIRQSLRKLENCLQQLSREQIWWRPHPAANSVGNLILHMCGNLRQWVLAGLGAMPDTRQRDQEFSPDLNWSTDELLQHLRQETSKCLEAFPGYGWKQLAANYTIQGFKVNGLQAINHTVTHFVGHTHQVIYITRLQLGDRYRFAWSPADEQDQLPI